MQPAVAGQHGARIERQLAAVQIAEAAAGFAHDHRERGDIENVDVGLDDGIELAGGEVVVMDEIAVAADAMQLRDQAPEFSPLL